VRSNKQSLLPRTESESRGRIWLAPFSTTQSGSASPRRALRRSEESGLEGPGTGIGDDHCDDTFNGGWPGHRNVGRFWVPHTPVLHVGSWVMFEQFTLTTLQGSGQAS